jgi:hypothetical protein
MPSIDTEGVEGTANASSAFMCINATRSILSERNKNEVYEKQNDENRNPSSERLVIGSRSSHATCM